MSVLSYLLKLWFLSVQMKTEVLLENSWTHQWPEQDDTEEADKGTGQEYNAASLKFILSFRLCEVESCNVQQSRLEILPIIIQLLLAQAASSFYRVR